MRRIILFSILFLLIPAVAFSAAPSRPNTYTTGNIIDPDENNANENALYNYLAAGVDTYVSGSVDVAAIGANAVGNSELINTDNFTFSGTNTLSGTNTFSGTTNVTGTLQIGGTTVTSTATELNLLDGETGDIITSGDTAGGFLTGTYPNPGVVASNIIFAWSGIDNATDLQTGIYRGTSQTPDMSAAGNSAYWFLGTDSNAGSGYLRFKFKKTSGINTLIVWGRLWSGDADAGKETILIANVGGQQTTAKSITSTSPAWYEAGSDIDVSGLTNGTVYDGYVQIYNETDTIDSYCSAVTIIGE